MYDAKEVTLRIDCPKEKLMRKVLIALLTLLMVGGFVFAQDQEGDTSSGGQGGTLSSKTITLKTSVEGDSDFVLEFAVVPNEHENGVAPEPPAYWSNEWNSVDQTDTLYLDVTGDTATIEYSTAYDSFFIVIGAKGNNLSSDISKTVEFTFEHPHHPSDKTNEVVTLKSSSQAASNVSEDFVEVKVDEENGSFTIMHPAGQLTNVGGAVKLLGTVLVTWDQLLTRRAGEYTEGSVRITITPAQE